MTHRIITAEEARALREAATPGPWHVGRSALCDCWRPCANVYADQGEDVTRPCRSEVSDGDAPLLAAAPDLAATVEALHAEVERAASAERARIVALLAEMAEATRGLDGRETVASFAYRSAILGVLELTP